ncbi:protein FAM171A1 isoform X1 [Labeo rohita]|uniref:Protein FAM171A1 isoform X1 n=1 Tax=Labeo rohita TaxID=84645 RepID=A0A498P2R8_LABRO|nr:protein FAM171A1 isoform X1 [Labeo rohita]
MNMRADSHGRDSWSLQWPGTGLTSPKSCDLHPAMFSALVGDKPEFVRLLLENGVCVRKFLEHEDTLCELYAHLPACFFLRKLAKRVQGGKIRRGQEPPPGSKKISLSHVADEVRHLLGSFTQPLYVPSRYKMTKDDVPSKGLVDLPCSGEEWTADTVWDPGRDLFLWAVVQNNRELAEIGWEQLTKTSLNLRSTSDESSIDSGDEYVPNSETDSEESESLSDNIDTSSSPVNADKECSPLGDKETTANLDSNHGSEDSVMKIKKTAYGQRMYNKKQYCFYSSRPFCKMARHLAQVHKNEVDVAKALSYPKGSKERRINLDLLRNKGNRAHNTDVLKSGKGVLVPRQQSSAKQVYVKDYVHCLNCQGLFRRKALWRHMSRCKLARMCQVTKPGRSRVQALCAYAEPVPEGVATKLWKLISDMKQDEVTCAVKSDACIIKFGEHLCNKMGNDKTKHEYIRIKMREAGRLLVSARKMGKLQSIKDFFIPANFHHVIKAVKETSGFRDDEVFGIPS